MTLEHRLSRATCKLREGTLFRVGTDEFVLGGKLGDGAVGLVRKANNTKTDERLAVKFLAPDPKYIEEEVFDDVAARFRREGERGSKLRHRSLLRIVALCENVNGSAFPLGVPSNPFLIMERAGGGTLEEYIKRIDPSRRQQLCIDATRLSIAIQVAEALEYLHKRKIVHRDVKPANVFLSGRQIENVTVDAKLGDFGIVKWRDFHASVSTGSLTATMHRGLGTMKYMSPEQALRPKEVDVKADVFSFGITLFELFTSQVSPSFHHVYEVMAVRDIPGTTTAGRWSQLGIKTGPSDDNICELILEMVRKGTTRRPGISAVRGRLQFEYEQRVGGEWKTPHRSVDDEQS